MTRTRASSPNNGEQIHVTLPGYEGRAGFREHNGLFYLEYRPASEPRKRRLDPFPATTVEIQGATYTVVKVDDDHWNKGFRTIALRKGQ